MKIIFAHDHKLRFSKDQFYTLGGLSDTVTARYTNLFDTVIVVCRAVKKQSFDTNLFEITNPHVSIQPIFSNSLIVSLSEKKRIKALVSSVDAVIVRLPSFIGSIVYKYAKQLNKPILSEVVTCPWDSYWNHGVMGKMVAPYMFFKTKQLVSRSDYTIYVTQDFLQRRYPTKGVQTGCSDVELKDLDSSILNRRLKKIEESDKILTLGTLAALDTSFKGQQYVILALSKLKENGFIMKYRLAGGGSANRLLEIAKKYNVSELIQIDGVIPHEKVFDWIDSLDLYIQPSLQEGLPRALVEAMSRACPAIGSSAGGIPELLASDCIFKKKDVTRLVDILQKIDKHYLEEKSASNYKKSLEYEKESLDKRREAFYMNFKHYVTKGVK